MWNRSLLKKNAKIAFMRNYWGCVLVCAIVLLLSGSLFRTPSNTGNQQYETEMNVEYSPEYIEEQMRGYTKVIKAFLYEYMEIIIISLIVGLVIGLGVAIVFYNILHVGINRYFLENREHKTSVWQLFYSFKGGRYGSTVWVMFLKTIYTIGWTIVFIVPGIIKSYSYMLIPYILAENPSLDSKRVFKLSQEMMYGHRWEAFKLELSFIGWMLLSAFTGGFLNIFYVNPYAYATYAEFYCALKADARRKGILQQYELPDRLVGEEKANA